MGNKTTKIVNISKQYNNDVDAYRKFAEGRRNATTYTQEALTSLYELAKAYFEDCKAKGEPVTIGKMCIALGISKLQLWRMRNGELDYRLPQYMDLYDVCFEDVRTKEDEFFKGETPLQYWTDAEGREVLLMTYSEIMSMCVSYIEAETEVTIMTGRKPVGAIFYAKSVFGYSDAPERAKIQAQPRVVDKEEAEASISGFIDNEASRRALLMLEADNIEKLAREKCATLREANNDDK